MKPEAVNVDVGEAPSGPVVEKFTAKPESTATALVNEVVKAAFVPVPGVAYVELTVPFSENPVGSEPEGAVCADQKQLEIVENVPPN